MYVLKISGRNTLVTNNAQTLDYWRQRAIARASKTGRKAPSVSIVDNTVYYQDCVVAS